MSNEFIREERYIVFKMSDLGNSLKGDEIRRLAREYAEQRRLKGKKPLECVVVEKDWPEYEPTWKAIETRVVGTQAQPTPSVPDIDYLVDTLSEFADHHVEHGQMSFDKWTLRSAVEAMLMHLSTTQPAPSVPDEEAAYSEWFRSEQGVAYDGMWAFAKAAWMARAALNAAPKPEAKP